MNPIHYAFKLITPCVLYFFKLTTRTHINSSIKKKEYEDASLNYNNSALMTPPSSQMSSSSTASSHHHHTSNKSRRASKKLSGSHHHHSSSSSSSSVPQQLLSPSIPPPHTQEVTLNMLNASDATDADLKMDFDSPSG